MNLQDKATLASNVLTAIDTPLKESTGLRRLSDVAGIAAISDMSIPLTDELTRRIETVAKASIAELEAAGFVNSRAGIRYINVTALFEVRPNVATIDIM